MDLLPNLAAEEGDDWRAYLQQPHARVAARLWSHLFSRHACFRMPAAKAAQVWSAEPCETHWPTALGAAPEEPVFGWLEESAAPTAWLNTESLEAAAREALGQPPCGPSAACIKVLHDKAFAIESARALGLFSSALEPLIRVIDVEALRSPDALIAELDEALDTWPEWTGGRFTLKPRHGSSGRGRVSGVATADTRAIRGALPRFAQRGGALFEPWLTRRTDLSVALHVPPPGSADSRPTILGSLEMLATSSGVFRGHCGEVDARGHIFSGHREDEALRSNALRVAARAFDAGFTGPCGIDAFSYLESDRERMRGLVEFNARPTMGLVTIGIVRRALFQTRQPLALRPGERRGFLLTTIAANEDRHREKLIEASGGETDVIDLATQNTNRDPHPILLFAGDRASLRRAHEEVLGC